MKPSKKAIENLAREMFEHAKTVAIKHLKRGEVLMVWETMPKYAKQGHLAMAKYILENFVHKKLIPPSGW